jgi:hypothetical protein
MLGTSNLPTIQGCLTVWNLPCMHHSVIIIVVVVDYLCVEAVEGGTSSQIRCDHQKCPNVADSRVFSHNKQQKKHSATSSPKWTNQTKEQEEEYNIHVWAYEVVNKKWWRLLSKLCKRDLSTKISNIIQQSTKTNSITGFRLRVLFLKGCISLKKGT